MMDHYVHEFVKRLITDTEDRKINWYPLSKYKQLLFRSVELDQYLFIANNEFNKVHIDTSYFIKSADRFIVLLHESGEDGNDGVYKENFSLIVIGSEVSPLKYISHSYVGEDKDLKRLHKLIGNYIADTYDIVTDIRNFIYDCLPGDTL